MRHSLLATCSHPDCGLTSPLWLCLVCGSLGCGRKQFGGTVGGGQGHGVEHYERTGHSIAVKLGTIEIGGTGGMFVFASAAALGRYRTENTLSGLKTSIAILAMMLESIPIFPSIWLTLALTLVR